MARGRDMDRLREQVGTFDAPIGAVQLPSDGVKLDRRGNPKPLQSGQDEHPEPAPRTKRSRRAPEPELAFTTDLFVDDPQQRVVLSACHKVLAGTQVTTDQLRRKLQGKGFEADDVEFGIDKCTAAGLLDDERYAKAFVQSRVRRGHGATRIRQDLQRKGVERQVVDAALAEHAEPEALADAATDAARRKFARVDLDDFAARTKALRWLMARGYASSQAQDAVRIVRQEQAEARS